MWYFGGFTEIEIIHFLTEWDVLGYENWLSFRNISGIFFLILTLVEATCDTTLNKENSSVAKVKRLAINRIIDKI